MLTETVKQDFIDHMTALKENKRASIQVPILHENGTEVPVEISSSLIELDEKLTILGVFRDISDRVRAEQKIRERDAQIQLSSHLASMGTLAAGVAHEINNPLTYVLGNLNVLKDLMREHKVESHDVNKVIEAALTGSRYVREIVSDLKAISRVDGGDETSDPCKVIRIASKMGHVRSAPPSQVEHEPCSHARGSPFVFAFITGYSQYTQQRCKSILPDRSHQKPDRH